MHELGEKGSLPFVIDDSQMNLEPWQQSTDRNTHDLGDYQRRARKEEN